MRENTLNEPKPLKTFKSVYCNFAHCQGRHSAIGAFEDYLYCLIFIFLITLNWIQILNCLQSRQQMEHTE